jgi:nucleoside-diphosphate-sugar epimerase
MKLLVLGGTRFVGRAVVEEALRRGEDVTVVSRGESGVPPASVEWFTADRRDPAALSLLDGRAWDAVVDTWAGEPDVVEESTARLRDSVGWYGYVSSRSVYVWPPPLGADESAPVVTPTAGGYAADKRAAEIAVEAAFADRCLLARAGLIVGPHEDTGRLTWWLSRAAIGGSMVAPAPPDRCWQCIDARDLAAFVLTAATTGTTGTFNVVGPASAGVTTERLLEACVAATGGRAELVWIAPEVLRRAGVSEWDDLPGWIAPDGEGAGLHACNVDAALAAGLATRPIEATVADTWQWLQNVPSHKRPPHRPGLPTRGLSAEQEQAIWWLAGT